MSEDSKDSVDFICELYTEDSHQFIPITWSLSPTMKTAHEFMCQKCLKIVTRSHLDDANRE